MVKYLQSTTFKMALSATIAIIISNYIGLQFGVTSGIIAILSIQDTKKEALLVAGRRIITSSVAILLSYILYMLLGNNPIVFGLFLLIFIPITKILKMGEGMVVGAVLSTHLLTSSNINVSWIINEAQLTIVGIGVAMMFNLYTASLEEQFEKNKERIEDYYRAILSDMAVSLVTQAVPIYEKQISVNVEELINKSKFMAQIINNNRLFKKNDYYLSYIEMRIIQLDTMKRMKRHFSRFYMTYDQTRILSEFTNEVAMNLKEDNDCVELINKLNLLRKDYEKMDLPKNRNEFENRALLFQFLNDLEDFLVIKKEFKESFQNR
ncbi:MULTISPECIES: aromatic acid exporter family protein [Clostridium]|uniref:Putative aromatic acid exporter C-terminal domain-containing protein n=1 Tax=Clostridium beijerinckii TaxID=1520 RepID=A0A1S9ND48_CLOBE|nr:MULTISPECIES: aromatic acid exporter family protein [Clostridium]MBN7575892.1 aromatic acid exporter family protein [Clostridium beijerinckii]MBN7581027.1 aromatic acid exporter family protein [Clostridium beijerinckii]MBN7585613.1 aromatic acid exporter family protein [Clostridium beijerinckii]MBO0521478.1 aromatic acid exporter family protein [Clostridium beijerinckii]MZK50304.1 aromatic acid exporter family protein [Clostridium beijerinckii]